MDLQKRNEIFAQAKKWIHEAGAIIREKINEPLVIDTKSNPNDLVTTMDKETEEYFSKKIKQTYPDHLLFGEEGYGDHISSLDGTIWIVDPIDGTMNFVHQKRNFAISIGIFHEGVGEIGLIYDVMLDELYSAQRNEGAYKNDVKLPQLNPAVKLHEAIIGINHLWLCENRFIDEELTQGLVKKVRGTRSYGSAALEFAYISEGIADAYIAMRLSPWDFAAGIVILHEVGGITTDQSGKPLNLLESTSIIACNQKLHEEIIDSLSP